VDENYLSGCVLRGGVTLALLAASTLVGLDAFHDNEGGGPIGSGAQNAANYIVDFSTPISIVPGTASFNYDSGGPQPSKPESVGRFENGITAAGTPLPLANRCPGEPIPTYSGGLGISSGVVISNGWISDTDSPTGSPPPPGRGYGAAGPNNGKRYAFSGHDGEISTISDTGADDDFVDEFIEDPLVDPAASDAAALQFSFTTSQPGFLTATTVFASDEHDAWDRVPVDKNDSFAIFVDGANIAKNIKIGESEPTNFTLFDSSNCLQLFRENQIAPCPSIFQTSPHRIENGAPYYDHEYGGFTVPIPWSVRLAAGTHHIKFVIQDIDGNGVDSALFIPKDGVRLITGGIVPGDCDVDGIVAQGDMDMVLLYWGQTVTPWMNGDCDGDGFVGQGDMDLVLLYWGDEEWRADFDRDGDVDNDDLVIHTMYNGLTQCALKEHGDADDDGDVDGADFAIWQAEQGSSYK